MVVKQAILGNNTTYLVSDPSASNSTGRMESLFLPQIGGTFIEEIAYSALGFIELYLQLPRGMLADHVQTRNCGQVPTR